MSKRLLKRKTTKKGEKNPYSDRGQDKFSALLAEIEEKKRAIYSQLKPEHVSMIRFVYRGDNELKPLVVGADNKKVYSFKEAGKTKVEEDDHGEDEKEKEPETETETQMGEEGKESLPSFSVQPWHYLLGGMVVLVLVLMAVFGRYWKAIYLVQLQATICPRI